MVTPGPDPVLVQAEQPGREGATLTAAAQRALAEAAARRAAEPAVLPQEVDGRGGLEPVRYGDWEVKGLASDF